MVIAISRFRITTLNTRPPHLRSAPPDFVGLICYFQHQRRSVSGVQGENLMINPPDNVGLSGQERCYKAVFSHGLGHACFLVIHRLMIALEILLERLRKSELGTYLDYVTIERACFGKNNGTKEEQGGCAEHEFGKHGQGMVRWHKHEKRDKDRQGDGKKE